MAMNQHRRTLKNNQPDCFKSWQTQRNQSCSPLRNSKRPVDMYRVVNQARTQSPTRNDSLRAVFVNHLRRQLPKLTNQSQVNTVYKQRKDNQNKNIKYTCATDNCKNFTENETNNSIPRNNRRCNKNKLVYFEDSNNCQKICSSSETDISSNLNSTLCRNRSVKNVIRKFNRLSQNHVVSKQTVQKIKKDTNFKNRNKEEIQEDSMSIKILNGKRNKDNETHKHINKSPKSQNIESHLRSQRLQFTNTKEYSCKAYCDDLLEMFKPKDDDEEKMKEIISPIPRKSVVKFQELKTERTVKELVSSQTQTTPCPSATNIMINVYNNKSPRLVQRLNVRENPIEINISKSKGENTTLSISQEKDLCERKNIEITKKNVKSCVEKFEANLKKKGVETEKDITPTKIFSKISSKYLLKKESETLLSPKAKSVPF